MKIFYSINLTYGDQHTAPGDELLVGRDAPIALPEDARQIEILAVRYRIVSGGALKILSVLPGEDGDHNPRFWVYVLGETLYLENGRGKYAIDLTALRGLTRSRRRLFLTRGLDEMGKLCHRRSLHHYYALDFTAGAEDHRLLLPEWSLPTLCQLTGWVVTDDGRPEFVGRKTQIVIRGMSQCGGCF